MLGPLQANGGPTYTMAPLPGSPVIDKGHSFGATTDQRGMARPHDLTPIANANNGDGSDIGAFEFRPAPLLQIAKLNGNAVLSWSADAADFQLESTTSLPATSWQVVTDTRVLVGGQVYVTNAMTSPMKFYRLSNP
jgi:hypothetical protein